MQKACLSDSDIDLKNDDTASCLVGQRSFIREGQFLDLRDLNRTLIQ